MNDIERPTSCPRCKTKLVYRPNARIFDPSGDKYGAMLSCPSCDWNDWGYTT